MIAERDGWDVLPSRRHVVRAAGAGSLAAFGGCLAHLRGDEGELHVASNLPDAVTLEIEIFDEYGDEEPTFDDTVQVREERLERTGIVTGRNGSTFYVVVHRPGTGETVDVKWTLECVGSETDDRLTVLVTEEGDIRFAQHSC